MTADAHFKMVVGEIVAQLALARLEHEKLQQTIAALEAQLATATATIATLQATASTVVATTAQLKRKKAPG